jgi:molecular chaperone DnaK
MRQDAETHATEDKKKQELIEARNIAESTVYTVEKMMSEYKDKLSDEEKKLLEEKMQAVKDVKDKEDINAMKSATEALNKEAQAIGAKMYQQQPNPADNSTGDQKPEEPKSDEAQS